MLCGKVRYVHTCSSVIRVISHNIHVAMGKTVSEEEKNKKSWDSNAITPGTPFMTLLAQSLRYWVAKKMNSDPGWAQVSVNPTRKPFPCANLTTA